MRLKLHSLIAFVIAVGILSCHKQNDEILPPEAQGEHPTNTSVASLRQAFEADYQRGSLRSSDAEAVTSTLSFQDIEPLWARARDLALANGGSLTLVPLQASVMQGCVADGVDETILQMRGGDVSRAYLIQLRERGAEQAHNYFMYLIPSLSFLKQGLSLDRIDSPVPEAFDGEVELYTLDGHRQYIYVYVDGQLQARYRYPRQSEGLRSSGLDSRDCRTIVSWHSYGTVENGEATCVGYKVFDVVCFDSPVPQIDHIDSDPFSGGGGGGGGGDVGPGYGGGGGGGTRPPTPKKPTKEEQKKIVQDALKTPALKERIDKMIADTNKESTAKGVIEKGAWVYLKGSKLYMGKTLTSASAKPGEALRFYIGDSSPKANSDASVQVPEEAVPLCFIHIHPPTRHILKGNGRPVGLSRPDSTFARDHGVIVVAYDYGTGLIEMEGVLYAGSYTDPTTPMIPYIYIP